MERSRLKGRSDVVNKKCIVVKLVEVNLRDELKKMIHSTDFENWVNAIDSPVRH